MRRRDSELLKGWGQIAPPFFEKGPILIAKRRNGHREVINDDLFAAVQKGMRR